MPEDTLCPRCQAQVQPDWPFCSHCGSRLDRTPPSPPPIPECHNCGATLDVTGAFCWKCGVPVATGREPFIPDPNAPPPGALGPGNVRAYPTARVSPTTFLSVDRAALSNVTLAAVMTLAGAALSLVVLLATPASSLIGVAAVGSGTSLSVSTSGLYFLGGVGGASVALTFLELWFFRRAFRTLARQDRRFATPATLVWLALVGLVIFVVAAIGLLVVLYDAILCAGPGTSSPLGAST